MNSAEVIRMALIRDITILNSVYLEVSHDFTQSTQLNTETVQ